MRTCGGWNSMRDPSFFPLSWIQTVSSRFDSMGQKIDGPFLCILGVLNIYFDIKDCVVRKLSY